MIIDPSLFRKAKNRACRQGKLGVCPFRQNDALGFFLLHRALHRLKRVCIDFSIPLDYIRTDKKSKYGYYYLKLYGVHGQVWKEVMRGRRKGANRDSWRNY